MKYVRYSKLSPQLATLKGRAFQKSGAEYQTSSPFDLHRLEESDWVEVQSLRLV